MRSSGKIRCQTAVLWDLCLFRETLWRLLVFLRGEQVCRFVVSLTYSSKLLSHEQTIRLDMILMSGIDCKSKADWEAAGMRGAHHLCVWPAKHGLLIIIIQRAYWRHLTTHLSICQCWTSPVLALSDWPAEMPIIVANRWRSSEMEHCHMTCFRVSYAVGLGQTL